MEKSIQRTCLELYWEAAKRAVLNRIAGANAPIYRNDLSAVEDIFDDPYHAELNAYYYLQRGQVLAERYQLPAFDWEGYHALREDSTRKAYAMWAAHEQEKRDFFLSVAEDMWNFDAFAHRYSALLSQEEIDAYHEYCKKIFIEERIFLLPEWVLFSSALWLGREAFLYEDVRVDYFCENHANALRLLPISVLQCKAFKKMLARKHKMKAVA